mmetsp:Transcript_114452/g.328804  ORF Transcript_114452/g.328804 Transcript_114452/m.328804 type:complete len:302 (-) Transcript_114452:524-1429(-)
MCRHCGAIWRGALGSRLPRLQPQGTPTEWRSLPRSPGRRARTARRMWAICCWRSSSRPCAWPRCSPAAACGWKMPGSTCPRRCGRRRCTSIRRASICRPRPGRSKTPGLFRRDICPKPCATFGPERASSARVPAPKNASIHLLSRRCRSSAGGKLQLPGRLRVTRRAHGPQQRCRPSSTTWRASPHVLRNAPLPSDRRSPLAAWTSWSVPAPGASTQSSAGRRRSLGPCRSWPGERRTTFASSARLAWARPPWRRRSRNASPRARPRHSSGVAASCGASTLVRSWLGRAIEATSKNACGAS